MVPSSLVVVNCTNPRSTLKPATKLLSWANSRSDDATCAEPPKLLVEVQVRLISPSTLGAANMPLACAVWPLVSIRGEKFPLRSGKHNSVPGGGQPVFCAFVPLP